MKKAWVKSVVTCSVVLFLLAGCGIGGTKKTETSETKSKSASSDVTTGASVKEYTDPSELNDHYDTIIVGAGGAGMSAAIQAKDDGKNPVIFEKMPVAGGNTLKASSGMNASETKFQKEKGIEDNNDAFYEET